MTESMKPGFLRTADDIIYNQDRAELNTVSQERGIEAHFNRIDQEAAAEREYWDAVVRSRAGAKLAKRGLAKEVILPVSDSVAYQETTETFTELELGCSMTEPQIRVEMAFAMEDIALSGNVNRYRYDPSDFDAYVRAHHITVVK